MSTQPKEAFDSLKPNTFAACKFLKAWPTFPVVTAIHIDKNGSKGKVETKCFPPDSVGRIDWAALHEWIDERQGKANLYFLVNKPRIPKDSKASKLDIESIVALHVDLDSRVGEDQDAGTARILETLQLYNPQPSILIASGGGAQAFWLLKEPLKLDGTKEAAEEAERYSLKLEQDLDGDHCRNCDRIMRLPGTINVPDAKKRAKGRGPRVAYVMESHPELRYSLDTFAKAPADKPKQTAPETIEADAANGNTDVVYEHVPCSDENTPIITIEDHRLSAVSREVKRLVIEGGPKDGPAKGFTDGQIDLKIVGELHRCNLTLKQVKQVYRLGKISSDACQWPRGFDGELDRLYERVAEMNRDLDIEAMNKEFAVMNYGGKTVIVSERPSDEHPGQYDYVFSSFEAFAQLHRNRFKWVTVNQYDEYGHKTGATKQVKRSLVNYWLKHPKCRQYNGGMKFMPDIDAREIGDAQHLVLNQWTGFSFEAKLGSWELFKNHIRDNLCNRKQENFEYLIKWMAFIAQFRKRTDVIVLLYSKDEGTGKSFFPKHYGRMLGRWYLEVHQAEHVIGKFNEHLATVLVLNPDEALFRGNHEHRNGLWSLTTSDRIAIEPKGFGVFSVKNRLNFILTTNDEHAVDVTASARRIFALEVASHQKQNRKYFDAIEDELKNGGYEAMLYELLHMDLTGFDVTRCPKTDALRSQQDLSLKGVDAVVADACNEGVAPGGHHRQPGFSVSRLFKQYIRHEGDRDLQRLGVRRVLKILDKKWGCITGRQDRTGRVRGFEWPPLDKLRSKFEALYGPQDWPNRAADWELPELYEAELAGGDGDRTF